MESLGYRRTLSAPQVPKNDPRDPWVSPYGTPRSLFWALWVTLGPLMPTHEPYKTPGTPQGCVGPPWDTRVSLLGSLGHPAPLLSVPSRCPGPPKWRPVALMGPFIGVLGMLWDLQSPPKTTHGSPHVCPNPPQTPQPHLQPSRGTRPL